MTDRASGVMTLTDLLQNSQLVEKNTNGVYDTGVDFAEQSVPTAITVLGGHTQGKLNIGATVRAMQLMMQMQLSNLGPSLKQLNKPSIE